ncbi:MAG: hypothetical protein V7603_1981 [Micromonosporaceae bacterium]
MEEGIAAELTWADLGRLAKFLTDFPYEGIVRHHPTGRMAKLTLRASRG